MIQSSVTLCLNTKGTEKLDEAIEKASQLKLILQDINLLEDSIAVKKTKYPFLQEGKIDDKLYPACRKIFDAVINANIPYGQTKKALELVEYALSHITIGEVSRN